MKNLLLFVFCFFLFAGLSAQLKFGAGASLDLTDGTGFGIQGRAMKDINETIGGMAGFTYFFKKNQISSWTIDVDVKYKLFKLGGEKISFNPFGGVQYAHFSADADIFGTVSNGEIGINLGLFSFFELEGFNVYLEPKFTINGREGLIVSAGIMF